MRSGSALLPVEAILNFADLEEGHVVLDIGPGRTGHVLFSAATRVGARGKVIGLDVVQETLHMLEGMRRQYTVHHIDLLWMDIEGIHDVPVENVDVVFVVNTAWMFKKHAEVFARLARSLGAEGKIVVVDWSPQSAHALAPRWDFCIDPEKLDIALAHRGLRAIKRNQITPFHWGRVYQAF
jgi:ubiquinone/menaquinone biosynthesis C-methylase UbiE